MKANSTENILLEQQFKIAPSNKAISDFLLDSFNPFNIKEQQLKYLNNNLYKIK